jgi:hypothetical protein
VNKTQLLIGSLLNDLYRVANCKATGSQKAATRFEKEAIKWARKLKNKNIPEHIRKITHQISNKKGNRISQSLAEDYLMYSIILQNYVSHSLSKNQRKTHK